MIAFFAGWGFVLNLVAFALALRDGRLGKAVMHLALAAPCTIGMMGEHL